MPDQQRVPVIDIDGDEAVSAALLELLNTFPGLQQGQRIGFSTLGERHGLAFFPISGAAITAERRSITGHVAQTCSYPFTIIYRAAPKDDDQRMRAKEFLDTLGKWLERQPVIVSGNTVQLTAYPALASGNRAITTISRTSPAYLFSATQDGIEDWTIYARLDYSNDFDT